MDGRYSRLGIVLSKAQTTISNESDLLTAAAALEFKKPMRKFLHVQKSVSERTFSGEGALRYHESKITIIADFG